MAAVNSVRLLTQHTLHALPQLRLLSKRVSTMTLSISSTLLQHHSRSFSDERKEEPYGTAIKKWFRRILWKYGQIKDEGEIQGQNHAQFMFEEIIQRFLKDKQLNINIHVLKSEMEKLEGIKSTYLDVFHHLMRASINAGDIQRAFDVYCKMFETEVDPTDETYDIMFSACVPLSSSAKDGYQMAMMVLSHMLDKGIQPSSNIFHTMIKTFAAFAEPGFLAAVRLSNEMLWTGCDVNHETIESLLVACECNREYGFRYAVLIWRKMRSLCIQPSLSTYHRFLACLLDCKAGIENVEDEELDNPNSFLAAIIRQSKDIVEKRKVSPSTVFLTSEDLYSDSPFRISSEEAFLPDILAKVVSLGSVVRIGMLADAVERLAFLGGSQKILHNIYLDKLVPNVYTFCLLMESSANTEIIEESFLKKLESSIIRPDIQFYHCIINRRISRGDFQSATSVLMLMREKLEPVNEETLKLLARNCNSVGHAAMLLMAMEKADLTPTVEVWVAFLMNAYSSFDTSYAVFVLAQHQLQKIMPHPDLSEVLEKFHEDVQQLISTKKKYPNAVLKEEIEEEWHIFCKSYADLQKREKRLHTYAKMKEMMNIKKFYKRYF